MTLTFSALGISPLLFLVQQLFLSRYYGNISASSAPDCELGLEVSSPVASDTSSFLLMLDAGHLFPSCHFLPVILSFLVHVGKHRRQRPLRQPVFILSRPSAPRLHLCLSAVAHSARLTARSLSSCQPWPPKVSCLKCNVGGDQNGSHVVSNVSK